MQARKTIFLFTPYTRRRNGNLTGGTGLSVSGSHKEVVAAEGADRVAIERVACAIGDDRADKPIGATDKSDGRHEVEGRTMPDRLEELVADRKARLGVEPALAVYQNVPVVVAPVARRGKKLSDRLREDVLAARRISTRKRRVAERLWRDVKENPLVADDRVPRDAAVDAKVLLAVLGRQEEKEVAATAAESDWLLYRDIRRVFR